MNEMLKINYETNEPTVSARDLYDLLSQENGVKGTERFSKWFERYSGYGFVMGEDFSTPNKKVRVQIEGTREVQRELEDYDLSVDMAKHICMLQRTERGKQIRQYLLDLEKAWNTPEQVMARALKLADKTIKNLEQIIEEQKPLVDFANKVSDSSNLIDMGEMAKLLKDEHIKIGRNRLFDWLRQKEILMKNNIPYQRYIESGYFAVKESVYNTPYGAKTQRTTLVTGKGQIYITEKLRKEYN